MTNLSNAVLKEPDLTAGEGDYVASFEHLRMTDVESVGGKNASLGEMISQLAEAGVRVPGGFATTAHAFRDFLRHSADGGPSLGERIALRLENLDIDDVRALAAAGAEIRQWIVETPFQPRLEQEIHASTSAWSPIRKPRCPSPCVPRPPPKTCRTRPSPASRRPS
jgi:pyruvate,water dikinase